MIYQNFYAELGKLLYGIAKSDGKVQESEWETVHNRVVNELVPQESHTDEYGTDAAYYVEMQFETLRDQEADPEDCLLSFLSYVDEHHTAFDDRLREATVRISQEVAGAFMGTHVRERDMLLRLQHKLGQLERNT